MEARLPFIRGLDEIRMTDRATAGEKGARLGELIHAGFTAPTGFCVTASAYRETLAANQLDARLDARLATTEIDDPVDLEQAAEEIRTWIEGATISPGITQEIQAALQRLVPKDAPVRFAVRASRVVDDVPNPAASGLQQAYLAVKANQVIDHIRKCWGIPWSSRAIYYRHRKKIEQKQLAMAAVVQPMVCADAGGVMFTANPLTGASNEIHIDGTWGLGEAVIAARCKPDHFVLLKKDPADGGLSANRAIVERAIASKDVMDQFTPERGIQTIRLPEYKQQTACLTDQQLTALADLGEQVEGYFESPQDIEWCCAGGDILLLQARPMPRQRLLVAST